MNFSIILNFLNILKNGESLFKMDFLITLSVEVPKFVFSSSTVSSKIVVQQCNQNRKMWQGLAMIFRGQQN